MYSFVIDTLILRIVNGSPAYPLCKMFITQRRFQGFTMDRDYIMESQRERMFQIKSESLNSRINKSKNWKNDDLSTCSTHHMGRENASIFEYIGTSLHF